MIRRRTVARTTEIVARSTCRPVGSSTNTYVRDTG